MEKDNSQHSGRGREEKKSMPKFWEREGNEKKAFPKFGIVKECEGMKKSNPTFRDRESGAIIPRNSWERELEWKEKTK